MEICEEIVKKNLGTTKCKALPTMPKGMISTPMDFKFTPEQMATPAAFKTAVDNAILAGIDVRIYLWPWFKNYTPNNEEAVYEETPLADMAVRQGKMRYRFFVKESLCLHKAMFTHNGGDQRIFIIDTENQMFGTEDVDGNFYGFTVSLLNVENLILNDGTTSTKTPIYVILQDPNEVNQMGALAKVSFIGTVKRLTDVEITITESDAANIELTVKVACDGTGVSGLVAGDFVVLDSLGVAQAKTLVSNGNGSYTLVATTVFTDGTVDLISAATLSVKAYEDGDPVEFEVGS